MNEIVRSDREIAAQINAVKRQTAQVCLAAAVEIGRLLCEAKATVPYGDWGSWLEDNVNYSQSTANNLMRLYQNYGEQEQMSFLEENSLEIFGNLSPSQALALLGMPREERADYVETHDMETTSVRDIEAEIAARKAAEEQAVKANEETLRALREEYEQKLEQQKQALEKAKAAAEKADAGMKEAAAKAKAEAEAALQEEMERLRQAAATAEAKLTTAGDAAVQRYKVYFESIQREYNELLRLGAEIRRTAPDTADKLERALRAVIQSMAQRVRPEEG